MLEALFGLSRKSVENEPLKIFMALSDVERNRAAPLQPETVDRLARDYRSMQAQYSLFSEVPSLSDKTILEFMDTAHAINQIHDPAAPRRRCRHHPGASPGCGRASSVREVSRQRMPTRRSPRCCRRLKRFRMSATYSMADAEE